jgi:heptosyltransferase I
MATLTFNQPPASVCIIRLSAIGDVTHLLPIIATLQQQWPETTITWIIGKVEYQLVKSLPGIEFIIFDKSNGLAEYISLRKKLSGRRFEILLMMQVALRANLIGLMIRADHKIGYDKERSRDFHSLFCKEHIDGPVRVHVLDTFFQFIEKLGIKNRHMDWLLNADPESLSFAEKLITNNPTVIINPCSSARKNNWRNWSVANYARVIDYLISDKGFQVILTGGPSNEEILYSRRIIYECRYEPVNLVGKTTLTQLLALLEQASCLIAPDTGPAHMGTVADIPVIGLYASSNPLRTGPYKSLDILVNAYPQALLKYKNKSLDQASWGERVRDPEVMKMISVKQVIQHLDECLNSTL